MTDCGCRSHNGFLTAKGLAEAAQRETAALSLEGLTPMSESVRLDIQGSVSGLRRDETTMIVWPTDEVTDEQFARYEASTRSGS